MLVKGGILSRKCSTVPLLE
uniref:Uncharacterized protein n=1 Tax=Anguilla anguilla TaxID=7936 RepID=A0A0E9UDV9_ANGAN